LKIFNQKNLKALKINQHESALTSFVWIALNDTKTIELKKTIKRLDLKIRLEFAWAVTVLIQI
jgi:hypothetical protein